MSDAPHGGRADSRAVPAVEPTDLERFLLVAGGHIFFETLRTGAKLDLFTILAERGPLGRTELAAVLGLADKPMRILLLGLTALGLLRQEGDRYANQPVAEVFLNRHSPRHLLSALEWEHHLVYRPMFHLLEAVRENRNCGLDEYRGTEATLYERLAHHPDLQQIFEDAMHDISVQANRELVQAVDFGTLRHVLDVGGGDGTNALALATAFPQLRVSIFELANICPLTRRRVAQAGLAERVAVVAGNCFTEPFPEDADGILFCHFCTIWSEDKNRFLLRKAHAALPAGGRVFIFNQMMDDNETGPLVAAMGSPYFLALATGEGMLYSWREYETWLLEAGFSAVQRLRLPLSHGVISGTR